MEYRKLGRTGVEVSSICLGTMTFGKTTSLDDSCAIVARAFDAGVNFIDTANVYSRGESEKCVGEAIKRLGKRDEIFLATKVHGRMKDGNHQPNRYGNHRRMIVEECHHSLQRLKTDYIDLYQIHRPMNAVPLDETLRALDDLIRQGKVRYIGGSNFPAWQYVYSFWIAKELGLNRFVCEQPPYHALDRRIERELIPVAQQFGLGIIVWSPLAGGTLTGKYLKGLQADARIQPTGDKNDRAERLVHDEKIQAVVRGIVDLAEAKGVTPSQLVLTWCRDQPGITAPIIGPRTMEQLEDNLGIIGMTLTESERDVIDQIAPSASHLENYYWGEWGPMAYPAIG